MTRLVLAAVLVVLIALPAVAVEGIPWTDDIEGAFRQAKERQVPVVVDVWAVWCVPCKRMEETTYRDPRVREALADLVPLKVDADTQTIFVERYRVQAYPETLFLDALGSEIGRLIGYVGADEFYVALENVRQRYEAYRAWIDGNEDDETVIQVGELLATLGSRGRASKALRPAARRYQEAPESVPESLRYRLAKALIASGEERDGASILFRLTTEASTRDLKESSLRALAALKSVRGFKDLADAAQERLDREFTGSATGGS